MFRILVSACAVIAGVSSQTLKAGLKTSLDISVLEQAKDVYFEEILKLINNLELPDLEDGQGNYLKDNSFQITESKEYVEFTTDVDKNAVIFANKKVSAVARSGQFRYKVAPLVVAKGHAEVDMNTIDIEIGLAFSTKTLNDGHVVPKVNSVDVKCSINRFDINIKLFGNIATDLASLFEVFFVGVVAGLIEETITVTLNAGVPLITNTIIQRTDGLFPVPFVPNWIVDWQTPEATVVTADRMAVGIKGLFFDKTVGEEEPLDLIPADMPYHSFDHIDKFQTYISSYVINGFCGSLTEVMEIKGWVHSAQTGLTTTLINALLPGIISYYGAGRPVDVFFQLHKLGSFQSFADNQEMQGVATLEL